MNKHREKCNHLKEIRKSMADSLGVELHQTVCTFEGDCKGTCPKCEKEERALAKALLKGTTVAASAAVLLTGCSVGPYQTEGVAPAPEYYEDIDGGLEEVELLGEATLPDETDEWEGKIDAIELEGDVAYIDEDDE